MTVAAKPQWQTRQCGTGAPDSAWRNGSPAARSRTCNRSGFEETGAASPAFAQMERAGAGSAGSAGTGA